MRQADHPRNTNLPDPSAVPAPPAPDDDGYYLAFAIVFGFYLLAFGTIWAVKVLG